MEGYRFYQRTMTLIIALGVLTTIVVYYGPKVKSKKVLFIGKLRLDVTTGDVSIKKWYNSSAKALNAYIGHQLNNIGGWPACEVDKAILKETQIICGKHAHLTITNTNEEGPDCYEVTWKSLSRSFIPYDCFFVETAHWYGGAEVLHDRWTIEKMPMKMQPFLSNDIGMVLDGYGNVMERYWLSSNGISITVDDSVPLHVSINKKELCFKADYKNSNYQNSQQALPFLRYHVCSSVNVLAAHTFVVKNYFTPSLQYPNSLLFHKPLWSTWAQFHKNITEDKVITYASKIKKYGFEGCQIEIDDGYMKHYGDFDFDPEKFPTPLDMSKRLAVLGFNVTTWVTPFVNLDSPKYKEVISKGYFVRSQQGNATVRWWRGSGVIVDFTNPEAVSWIKAQLQQLKAKGVTAFKFDAGESNFLPNNFLTKHSIPNANHYGHLYASHMHNFTLTRQIEVRVGYRSQNLPVMVRMMDKDSCWGYERGLKTLIPTALLFGILGYPYVLPDMVGGNGWVGNVSTIPSKDIYLRWIAATVLLPFVQFSIPPWTYDDDTVQKTHDLLKLRKRYLPVLHNAARESALSAYPIIRPLWWIDPENEKTFDIDSQFLVGDSLLVAPILHKALTRNIYLPRGRWKDMREGKVHEGRGYITNYKADLNELPIFRKMSHVLSV